MIKALDIIVKEANPKYDFNRVKKVNWDVPSSDLKWKQQLKSIGRDLLDFGYFYINTVKHIARGTLYGAAVGVAASFFVQSGEEIQTIREFAAYGLATDVAQYYTRGFFIPLFKRIGRDGKKIYTSIKNDFGTGQEHQQ